MATPEPKSGRRQRLFQANSPSGLRPANSPGPVFQPLILTGPLRTCVPFSLSSARRKGIGRCCQPSSLSRPTHAWDPVSAFGSSRPHGLDSSPMRDGLPLSRTRRGASLLSNPLAPQCFRAFTANKDLRNTVSRSLLIRSHTLDRLHGTFTKATPLPLLFLYKRSALPLQFRQPLTERRRSSVQERIPGTPFRTTLVESQLDYGRHMTILFITKVFYVVLHS